jgi:protein SCO1/2
VKVDRTLIRARRVLAVGAAAALVALTGCGDDEHPLVGITRDPEPVVDGTPLPDLSEGGQPFTMRAEPGSLLVVYFGFTNCPDVCPTTLADLRVALDDMDTGDADRVDLAMVTIDPERDIPLLTDYVQTFVPGAHALGTDDDAALQAAAAPFGVSYFVETAPNGKVEVSHSSQSFVVDDQGRLVLTWSFGTPPDDLAADLEQLLDERA